MRLYSAESVRQYIPGLALAAAGTLAVTGCSGGQVDEDVGAPRPIETNTTTASASASPSVSPTSESSVPGGTAEDLARADDANATIARVVGEACDRAFADYKSGKATTVTPEGKGSRDMDGKPLAVVRTPLSSTDYLSVVFGDARLNRKLTGVCHNDLELLQFSDANEMKRYVEGNESIKAELKGDADRVQVTQLLSNTAPEDAYAWRVDDRPDGALDNTTTVLDPRLYGTSHVPDVKPVVPTNPTDFILSSDEAEAVKAAMEKVDAALR